MNTKYILTAGIVVVVVSVVGWSAFSGGDSKNGDSMMQNDEKSMEGQEMMKKDDEVMPESGVMMEDKDSESMMEKDAMMEKEEMMMAKGSYEAYGAEKLALAEKGKVVLFFRASWCPTCRGLDADIRANLASIPAGVHILDVNYDDSTSLKQKYGVTYQHTFVQVDSKGNQIAKWSSSPSLSALLAKIK